MSLIPVILSGGVGARLWPLSGAARPKPFIALPDGSGTLLGRTYERAAALGGVRRIVTVTGSEHFRAAAGIQERTAAARHESTFLLEPSGRDTAAAVALAALDAEREEGGDAVLLVLPADHLIGDHSAFAGAVDEACGLARQGRIVTFGVPPERPETGFGYIESRDGTVLRFVEKPDVETARRLVGSGRFLWNSGMLCFPVRAMLEAMRAHCPRVLETAGQALAAARRTIRHGRAVCEVDGAGFAAVPAISIDYAVMEKLAEAACVRLDCGWRDVGSWTELASLSVADDDGNRAAGNAFLEACEDCFVHAGDRPVGLVGVSGLIVVDTPGGLLVAHRDSVHEVRRLAERMKPRE